MLPDQAGQGTALGKLGNTSLGSPDSQHTSGRGGGWWMSQDLHGYSWGLMKTHELHIWKFIFRLQILNFNLN